jgi:hypothetical protein
VFVTGVVAIRYLEKKSKKQLEMPRSLWRKIDYDVRRRLAVYLFVNIDADD